MVYMQPQCCLSASNYLAGLFRSGNVHGQLLGWYVCCGRHHTLLDQRVVRRLDGRFKLLKRIGHDGARITERGVFCLGRLQLATALGARMTKLHLALEQRGAGSAHPRHHWLGDFLRLDRVHQAVLILRNNDDTDH